MRKASPRSLAQAQILADHHNLVSSIRGDSGRDSRMDADETNMLALALEQMRTRVYEDKFALLKARLFLPTTSEVDTGAESYAFEETTEVGEAKIISNYADDLPTVETSGTKVTHAIVSLGDSYHYSIQDIRRAAFSGRPLVARKAIAARRIWERKLDEIAAIGAPEAAIATGALNNASVAIEALASAGTWGSAGKLADPSLVLDDMNALTKALVTGSQEHYFATRVLVPLDQFMQISQSRMTAENPETVREAFLRANPTVTSVDPWNKLAGAGVGPSDRIMAYMQDPEVIELVIPQEFEVLPPQPKNLAFQVLAHGRTAGTAINRPLGVVYMDGV